MMFLYKRQPLHAQKIKKHIGQLQKHRETQHLEKAYPPVLNFQAKNAHNLP